MFLISFQKIMIKINNIIKKNWLLFVNAISLVGIVGSLYFSEVEKIAPCNFCWYQRIFLYPIFLITSVAIIKKQKDFFPFVIVLSVPGMFFSMYQYLMQKTDIIVQSGTCSVVNPCSQVHINWLGFITFPLLSFIAFTAITVLSLWAWKLARAKK